MAITSDSEEDPDYVPTDDESKEWFADMRRNWPDMHDRCAYIRLHRPVLDELYSHMLLTGREALGDAFLQHCTPERFYTFVYCSTQFHSPMWQPSADATHFFQGDN